MKELTEKECMEMNGGFLIIAIPLVIAFGVGMYVGYNDAASGR